MILLGAYHGLNPGMGWLFALSLGLQQRRRAAVLWALVPIALGHAMAIALTLAVVGLVQLKIPFAILKFLVAAILFALGLAPDILAGRECWWAFAIWRCGPF